MDPDEKRRISRKKDRIIGITWVIPWITFQRKTLDF